MSESVLLIRIEEAGYRVLLANKAHRLISGYNEDIVGKLVKEILPKQSYEYIITRYQEVQDTRSMVEFQREVNVPIGNKHYNIKMLPVNNAVGDVTQILVISKDITELVNQQAETERLLVSVESILETIKEPVLVLNANNDVTYVCQQAVKLFKDRSETSKLTEIVPTAVVEPIKKLCKKARTAQKARALVAVEKKQFIAAAEYTPYHDTVVITFSEIAVD